MDRRAWWATVHGVKKSWTWLKWLSTDVYYLLTYIFNNWFSLKKRHLFKSFVYFFIKLYIFIEFWEFLMYAWYKPFVQYDLESFILLYGLTFYLINGMFYKAKFCLILMKSNLSISSYISCALGVISEKLQPKIYFFLLFSPRIFITLWFTLKSMMIVDLIYI